MLSERKTNVYQPLRLSDYKADVLFHDVLTDRMNISLDNLSAKITNNPWRTKSAASAHDCQKYAFGN